MSSLSTAPLFPPGFAGVFEAWLACVGLAVGSFLNVVVWRLPQGLALSYPGSHCPHCGASIAARDNIPVLAWVVLGGRCRTCRGPIALRYPVIEGLTGGLTVAFLAHDGLQPILGFHLVFVWGLIALALIDLDTWQLPFRISIPLIFIGAGSGYFDPDSSLARAAIGGAIGYALIVLVGFVGELVLKKEAMGGGDAYLMASIGAFCGPALLWVALFLASIQGVIYGVIQLRRSGRAGPATPAPAAGTEAAETDDDDDDWEPDPHHVPFGPFLALGAIETLLFGHWIAGFVPILGVSWPPT